MEREEHPSSCTALSSTIVLCMKLLYIGKKIRYACRSLDLFTHDLRSMQCKLVHAASMNITAASQASCMWHHYSRYHRIDGDATTTVTCTNAPKVLTDAWLQKCRDYSVAAQLIYTLCMITQTVKFTSCGTETHTVICR